MEDLDVGEVALRVADAVLDTVTDEQAKLIADVCLAIGAALTDTLERV